MTPPPFRVLILGHGEMGQAMEYLLQPRQRLSVWERRPKSGQPLDLEAVAGNQDFIIFCLPAIPHFDLATRLRPSLSPNCLCLSIAKGLDNEGRTAAAALAQALGPGLSVGVLYGPMISEVIRADRPAFAQVGATHTNIYDRVRQLFESTTLALEYTPDITGISWSAVLKNVYAIVFGAADEMALGDNLRGYLTVAAVRELGEIVTTLGGSSAAARGLAGLGDLITTATSAGSHHHELGRRLARGQLDAIQGEGVHTLETVRARKLIDYRSYPVFHLIGRLLAEPEQAKALMENFLDHLRHHPPRAR
jgi:glycerol-3-phosphate dehydrogenase (NAD(P)+)